MCVCVCVCMCVCVCEGGRERERMTKNGKQEMKHAIVLEVHGTRERECMCV